MESRRTPDTREEAAAKLPALHMLIAMGWNYLPPAECLALRGSERAAVLEPVLRERLSTYRHEHRGTRRPLSADAIAQVIRAVTSPASAQGLLEANKAMTTHLTLGVTVTEFVDGAKLSLTIPLIDWSDPTANAFHVTEEFSLTRAGSSRTYRPDIVCFVNGLPLAVIEAKRPVSAGSGKPTVKEGISQHLRNQKQDGIPDLYAYAQLLLSISGAEARYGTTGTGLKFWSLWRDEEIGTAEVQRLRDTRLSEAQKDALFAHRPRWAREGYEALHAGAVFSTEQDATLAGLMRPDRLLDMARRFTFFDRGKGKIIARYQQVFAVKALAARIAQRRPDGGREGGVIWHTTGSGKSNLMVLLCRALLLGELANARIIVVTDRVDLEKQLAGTFLSGGAFGSAISDKKDGDAARTGSGAELARRIGSGTERIIFTLLQKFNSATKLPECRNASDQIIVLVDEGHRSQGGENHERMRQALPNAAYIAFTGTPLLKEDKTRNKFGPILHAYTMQQAVEDGAVTPLIYEEREPKVDLNEAAVDAWFEKMTADLTESQRGDLKKKFSSRGRVYGASNRIELIAWDIAQHFDREVRGTFPGIKAQLATDSKLSAIRYKAALDATGKVSSAVVISPPDTREDHEDVSAANSPEVQRWWKANVETKGGNYEEDVIEAFAKEADPEILIVVDKLLTGFDEPKNAVLYIDKFLKSHNLLQAIARVNRLHDGKKFGYLIDYRGILSELDTSIRDYQDLAEQTQGGYEIDDLAGTVTSMATEYKRLPGLHDALWAVFKDVKNTRDFQQMRAVLSPKLEDDDAGMSFDRNQKVRDDFYAALTAFGMCLKLALSSRSFFEDGAFSEAKVGEYKQDLRDFTDLREQAKADAQETVDFSEYEAQVRKLVDTHVVGVDIKQPEGVIPLTGLGGDNSADPEDWNPEKTRNEADLIKTRVKKTIEQDLDDDPYAQKVFSELLRDAIRQAEAMFDHPLDQYVLFKDIEAQVKARAAPDIPDAFGENRLVRAVYGLFLMEIDADVRAALGQDRLIAETLHVDAVVCEAIQTHSLNQQGMENEIEAKLLPAMFGLMGGIDPARALISRILGVVRAGPGKSR